MAANKIIRVGPVALTTTTTTNVLNPPAIGSGGLWSPTGAAQAGNTVIIIRHVAVTNKTAAAAQFALWLGATGVNTAGLEFIWGGVASAGALTRGQSVPAQSYVERYGLWRLEPADFIIGGTDTATALTIEFECEIGIV